MSNFAVQREIVYSEVEVFDYRDSSRGIRVVPINREHWKSMVSVFGKKYSMSLKKSSKNVMGNEVMETLTLKDRYTKEKVLVFKSRRNKLKYERSTTLDTYKYVYNYVGEWVGRFQ